MVDSERHARAMARAAEIFARLEWEEKNVETRSYTEYVQFMKRLKLKSGPPQIATYAEWAKMEAES